MPTPLVATCRARSSACFVEVESAQATYSVFSLPPCGGGLQWGVTRIATLVPLSRAPTPNPSPQGPQGSALSARHICGPNRTELVLVSEGGHHFAGKNPK